VTADFCRFDNSREAREEYEAEEDDDHSDFHLFEDTHWDDDDEDEDEEPYQHKPQQEQEQEQHHKHQHEHQHNHNHNHRPQPTYRPSVDPNDPFVRLAETVRSEHKTALNARSKALQDSLRWSGELEEASDTVRSLQAKLAAARIHERDCSGHLQTAEDSLRDHTETAELSALHLRLVTERIVPNPRARKLILARGLSLSDSSSGNGNGNGKCRTSTASEIDCETETNSVASTSLGVIRLGSRRAQNLRENTIKGASAPKGNKHEPGKDQNQHHHLGLAKNKLSRILDLLDQVERFRRDDKRAQILLETAASKYVSYQREAQEQHHHQQQQQQHC